PARGAATTAGYTVLNNISVLNHGSQLTLRPQDGEREPRSRSDHNMLFAVGAILAKNGWDGTAVFELKEWQKISGYDVLSLDADPHFAMAVMNDFRLLPKSPALKTGTPVPEVDHDFFNQTRGRDKTSLGACELAA